MVGPLSSILNICNANRPDKVSNKCNYFTSFVGRNDEDCFRPRAHFSAPFCPLIVRRSGENATNLRDTDLSASIYDPKIDLNRQNRILLLLP